jgi:superfamily II DNA or RNA helicase
MAYAAGFPRCAGASSLRQEREMSVSDQIAEAFPQSIRDKGEVYSRQSRVTLMNESPDLVEAVVHGSDDYDVDIERVGDQLEYECTCPYYQSHGSCKHIWATLLTAYESGVMELSDFARTLGQKNGSIPAARQPAWKRQLSSVRQMMNQPLSTATAGTARWPATRRLVYLVSVPMDFGGTPMLVLRLATQTLSRSNSWGRARPVRLEWDEISELPDPADRQILRMLAGVPSNSYYHDRYIAMEFPIQKTSFAEILKPACETGRCFAQDDDLSADVACTTPLRWDDGPPWELFLGLGLEAGGERYVLDATLKRGEERLKKEEVVYATPEGLVISSTTIARFEDFGAYPLLAMIWNSEKPITLAVAQADELVAELASLPALPKLELPEALRVKTVSVPMRPSLKITPPDARDPENTRLVGKLSFDYGGSLVPENGTASMSFDPNTRTVFQRDRAAEMRAIERLNELKFKPQWSHAARGYERQLHPSNLNKTILQLCSEGWHVEAEGKLFRQPGEFKFEVSSGIDWFELNGSIDFGGVSAKLPRLLSALRKGERTVVLDDGSTGVLPDEWLARYGLLARIASGNNGDQETVRFSRGQVGLLDALVANLPHATTDEVFQRARRELLEFEGVEPIEPAPAFQGVLRPYQKQGLGWLNFLQRFGFGGCLADDMGLGKTVQLLALLESRRHLGKPSLVVVPRSLVFNWKEEARKFTPQLRILDHSGVGRDKTTDNFTNYDLIITTYGTLRLDAPFIREFNFDYAILDEAQAIKNSASESAKAARLVRADHRLALSGTPVQNHLGELWSLFEFLNPGMLGTASVFRASGAGSSQIERDSRTLLARALRPFILRRTKEQVATDLPEKTEQTLFCEMEPEQRKLYDELRHHYRASLLDRIATEGINKAKIQILEALLRLRQAACHPGLIDKSRTKQSSAKLSTLLFQLDELMQEDHKVLIFSQFTSMLAIVKKHLDDRKIVYEYLDGKTRDRQARVDRFQTDPGCKIFLISLKAGGLGLNLTAAEYVFLLDPWWNPAIEAQAIDRAHRIGQTRNVFAYRIIAKDTVEEKVLALQAQKKDLADMIINADNSLISKIGREDLELLLS